MDNLHFFLILLFLLSNILVFFVQNPVYSLLFLILMFCETGVLLFIFNVEFLALIFILIYVGAIAILFLFMVMMLNIKHIFDKDGLVPDLVFLLLILLLYVDTFKEGVVNQQQIYQVFESNNFDIFTDLELLSQVFYNDFLFGFLIIGLILLITLIGVTFLAASLKRKERKELFLRQIIRSNLSLTFFHFEKIA